MTTPDEDLQELQARLIAGIEPITDAAELERQGIRAHLAAVRGTAALPPDRPEVDVRLHGRGVPGHEVAVRYAAPILLSLQEAVSSIGQALRYEPTLHGTIQALVIQATELRLTSTIFPGSVGFHLIGAGEAVTGNEARELVGTDTLVDAAMAQLFSLVEHSATAGPDSESLAEELRRLGPRTAKHLADLVSRIIGDEVDLDLMWRNPAGHRRYSSLRREGAEALDRAIARNKVDSQIVEMTGELDTISTAVKAQLKTDKGRIHMSVPSELAAQLGPYYNRRVVATIEVITTWSTSTGKETKKFRLVNISNADGEEGNQSVGAHESSDPRPSS